MKNVVLGQLGRAPERQRSSSVSAALQRPGEAVLLHALSTEQ